MNKLIALALFLISCTNVFDSSEKLAQITKSIGRIHVTYTEFGKEQSIFGTAFFIHSNQNSSIVITNRHICIKDKFAKYVLEFNSEIQKLDFLGYSNDNDLCILKVFKSHEPLTLNIEPLKFGQKIISIGGPQGEFPVISDGRILFRQKNVIRFFFDTKGEQYNSEDLISSFLGRTQYLYINTISTSAPIYGGSSGSPVFNENGEVVGIMFLALEDFHHVSYMIPSIDIVKYVSQNLNYFK